MSLLACDELIIEKEDEGHITLLIDICIGSNGADYDVANVVYTMFKHQYCYHTTKNKWYIFKEDECKWECSKDVVLQLRKLIYKVIYGRFIARANYWHQQAMIYNAEEDSTQNDACQLKSKKCMEISLKLKKLSFNDSIIKLCMVLFTNPKFEELLMEEEEKPLKDENKNLKNEIKNLKNEIKNLKN